MWMGSEFKMLAFIGVAVFSANVAFPMGKANDHAHHFVDVLRLKEHGSVGSLERFSTEIDKYDHVKVAVSHIVDPRGQCLEISPRNHRYIFHWGYSIGPSDSRTLQAKIARQDFREDQIDEINQILSELQIERNKKLIKISQEIFSNRRKSSAMAAILYDLHILADYLPNDPETGATINRSFDGLMDIKNLYGELISSIRKAFGTDKTKDLVRSLKKLKGKRDVYKCQELLEDNLPYLVYYSFGGGVSSLSPDELLVSPVAVKLAAYNAKKLIVKAAKEVRKAAIRKVLTGGLF